MQEMLETAAAAQVGRTVPGLAVVVADTERVVHRQGFGHAELATRTAMTPAHACNWFSMTKLVTATAAVQLADQGRLDLDAPVAELYEPVAALRPAEHARRISTRHLLSHSSGIGNPLPLRWVHAASVPGPERSTFVESVLSRARRLRAEPGARAAYTNVGYLVLGEVVARASGEPFEEYVGRHVLTPLGMHDTGFVALDPAVWAQPYQRRGTLPGILMPALIPRAILGPRRGRFRELHHFYVNGAAYGGLVGPADDAARFLRAHLRDGELDGARILSREAARSMREIVARGRSFEVGLGWFRRGKDRPDDYVEHLGGGAGFWTCLRIYPGAGRGVVVMGNATTYDHEAIVAAACADDASASR